MKELVKFIAQALVDNPEQVQVNGNRRGADFGP